MSKAKIKEITNWLVVGFDKDLKHELKVQAAKEDLTLKELAEKMSNEYLTKHKMA